MVTLALLEAASRAAAPRRKARVMAKILLVDDSPDLLEAYVIFMESTTSHELRSATTGRAAFEIVRTWRPDIVVTDVMMAEMNGLELISEIRSQIPPPLPILVALSGFPEFEQEARRRGARVFQAKPIDTDDLVILIESLVGEREPPGHLREATQGRRQRASALAEASVSATLARRPYFRDVMQLNARLMSRYFGGADVGLLVMREGHMRVFAASDHGRDVWTRPEAVLGFGLDVIASGSTLIVPDLPAMAAMASRPEIPDVRLLAAAPVRSPDGITIGALAIADRRPIPFDVHDLAILDHIATRNAAVFAGADRAPTQPGVLPEDSWRYVLHREVDRLRPGRTLVIGLASLAERDGLTIPVTSAEEMKNTQQAIERLLELLPPRTALGRLAPSTLAVYGVADDVEADEHALLSLIASLDEEPGRACVGLLTVTGLCPTDGGAALLEVAGWLLTAAVTRGPATVLRARVGPEAVDPRLSAR
jgi:CheY-like chemotaxis protein